ncbi:MAG: Exodeoxyribonuclease 7 small subunit [Alphaproteobacteria bacterium MarineAlpha3_Bin4]|nr:exodeoxyribonuclease VII small subunit [Pseudomonadota bacterium]PPR76637.1 MAG: Exodeoxyribonuclease 7 small subunit [Alphaproteobacteria bacterium MarineAlpha3_Bin4]
MVETKVPDDIKKMSFEAALAEIEDIVRELESGQGELNEAINAYSRGAALKQHCETKLKEAQAKIDKIVLGPDGEVSSEPADLD